MAEQCRHLVEVRDVAPLTPQGCEECLRTGGRWLHLRNSPGKHATKHFHSSGHPIMRSFEPGEDWSWCYVDELFIEPAVKPHR